jgi:multidrug efflux pump subunit AcrB
MRRCAALVLVPSITALALVAFSLPQSARAADDAPVLKIQATAGDSLSAAETAAITRTMSDYLEALRKKDYLLAGSFIDRTTLLASSEPTLQSIEPDSTKRDTARRRVFGVSTRDSLAQLSTGEIFAAFMAYMDATSPGANGVLANATIQVLAARRMKDTVHVAYQLTLPPSGDRKEPYTQVTAQQMKMIDGKWKILVTE